MPRSCSAKTFKSCILIIFVYISIPQMRLLLQATDADGESQGGGKVFYSLEEGNTQDEAFFVEPVSGMLTIQRPLTHLDTPTSTYTLTIRATDAGNTLSFAPHTNLSRIVFFLLPIYVES